MHASMTRVYVETIDALLSHKFQCIQVKIPNRTRIHISLPDYI